jgi:tripartite-type tricarboxylate transporter receptor subunit TctC
VPYAAGGPADLETRLYAAKLNLGQPVVVDYKPGAAAAVGTAFVGKAAPDGHTLLLVSTGFTTFPALYKDLPFDTERDFAPITQTSRNDSLLLARPGFPARNFTEYVAYARSNPGKINFGTAGAGGIIHLAAGWMHSATQTQVTFVHYKGGAPAVADMLGGRIDVATQPLISALPLIKSGKAVALAILNDRRSPVLPQLATVAEQGIPGYSYGNWYGIVAPARTPAAVVSRLNEAFVRMTHDAEVVAVLEAAGSVLVGSTAAQFRQLIQQETARWVKVVKDTGIQLEP